MGGGESVASKHDPHLTDQQSAAAVKSGAANDGNGSQATETVPHFYPTFPGTSLFSWENAITEYS